MSRPLLRAALAAALLAAAHACWVPDLSSLDGKACDDTHLCVRGVCLANQCVLTPPGKDASTPVLVTRSVLRVGEDGGATPVPETPSPVELLVENTAGGFVALQPTVADAGLVVFWDVPPQQSYLLRFGSRYFLSDAGAVDLSERVLGRPDLEAPLPGTALFSQIDCLASWDPQDQLQLTAAGAGLAGLDLATLPGWVAPLSGSNQLRASEGWTTPATPGLIQTSRGDRPVYTQLEHNAFSQGLPDGGQVTGDRWLATRALSPATLEMANGVETILPRDCIQGFGTQSAPALPVRGAAFGSHLAEMGPGATPSGVGVAVSHALWPAGPGPDLFRAAWSTADDLTLNMQEVKNLLFPAAWPKEVRAAMTAAVPVALQLDGGSTTALEQVTLATRRAYPLGAGELAPALSPPRAVMVNGQDAAAGLTGVGLLPEVTWTAPALGTPAAYEVTVWREQDPSRQKAPRLEGAIWTDIPRIRIPPGLLAPRSTYVLHLRAVAAPMDERLAPLLSGMPFDEAATVTGLIEP